MDPNEGRGSGAAVSPAHLQSLDSKPQRKQLQDVEQKEVEHIFAGLGSVSEVLAPSKGQGDSRAQREKGEKVEAGRSIRTDRRRSDGGKTLVADSARRRSLTPMSAQQEPTSFGYCGLSASCDNVRPPWKIAKFGGGGDSSSGSGSAEDIDDSFKCVNRGLEKPRDREEGLGDGVGGRQGQNPFEQGGLPALDIGDEKMMAGYSPISLVMELEENSAPFEGFRRAASIESSGKSQSYDAPEQWSTDGPPSTLSRSSSRRLTTEGRSSMDGTFSRSASYRQRLAGEEQDIVTPLSPSFPRFNFEAMATRQGNLSTNIKSSFPSLQEIPCELPGSDEQRDQDLKRFAWREQQGRNSFSISYHSGTTGQGGANQRACDGWAGGNDDSNVNKSMSFDHTHKPHHGFFEGLSMALRNKLMSAFVPRSNRRGSRSSNHASRSSIESASASSKYDPSNSHASRSQSPVRNCLAQDMRKRSQSPTGRYSARKGRTQRPISRHTDMDADDEQPISFSRWALMRSASNASSSSGKNSSRDMDFSFDEALDGSTHNTAATGATLSGRRASLTGAGVAGSKSLSVTGSFIQR